MSRPALFKPFPLKSLALCIASSLMLLLSACEDSTPNKPATSITQPSPHVIASLNIQLNQLGYASANPKQAVVRLARDLQPNTMPSDFSLLKNGQIVFNAPLQAQGEFSEWNQLGGTSPSRHDYAYWRAVFSQQQEPGRYQLAVTVNNEKILSDEFEIGPRLEFTRTAESLINYFTQNRYTDERDKSIRVFGSDRKVNVWGGWMDAGGDTGKYLSHLSYANFMNPQQGALVTWALAKSYNHLPGLYQQAQLQQKIIAETFWGADYLHRILDPEGYFYLTVFDGWGSGPERMVTCYVGLEGEYTKDYQAAMREGGGLAIAALASAARLAQQQEQRQERGQAGEFSAAEYLADAERAFAFLQKNNRRFCDDGRENIIDDYTGLIAANELFRATGKTEYLAAARVRAGHLNQRLSPEGWFISDGDLGKGEALGERPFFHGVEAGLPLIALVDYAKLEPEAARVSAVKLTLRKALDYQLQLTQAVTNPYGYARQTFKTYKDDQYGNINSGFFMPHANETNYWWQGESARLASLAAASIWSARLVEPEPQMALGVKPEVAQFAQSQLDWILGKNPYGICMLYGFGAHNPPSAESAGSMVNGGISNGITGATASDAGRGITWAEGPDENDWRWVEQWLPHTTWFLLALTAANDQQ